MNSVRSRTGLESGHAFFLVPIHLQMTVRPSREPRHVPLQLSPTIQVAAGLDRQRFDSLPVHALVPASLSRIRPHKNAFELGARPTSRLQACHAAAPFVISASRAPPPRGVAQRVDGSGEGTSSRSALRRNTSRIGPHGLRCRCPSPRTHLVRTCPVLVAPGRHSPLSSRAGSCHNMFRASITAATSCPPGPPATRQTAPRASASSVRNPVISRCVVQKEKQRVSGISLASISSNGRTNTSLTLGFKRPPMMRARPEEGAWN